MQLGRTEEAFPLVELREVEVRPPQSYGLNGYSPSLVVRDVSGVVVVAIDGSPEACCACGSRDPYLHAFADALRVAISGAQRGRPLPGPLLASYREYASLSWIGLDRARQGIEYLPGHDQHGAPVPTGSAMVPMGGVVAPMGEVVVGVEISGAVGPTPQFMHRQAAQIGVPIAFDQASQAEPIAYAQAFGAPPPFAYPSARLSAYPYPPARPTGGRANEKLDAPLLDKTAGGSSSNSNSSMAPSHHASAEPTAPLTAQLAFGAAAPAAGVPPGNEVLSVRVPVEAFASGVMQFVTPDGQTMQVGIPLGLGAGDIFHVVRPVRQAHWHSSGADMAQQPCQDGNIAGI
jgi:hypothetical protein